MANRSCHKMVRITEGLDYSVFRLRRLYCICLLPSIGRLEYLSISPRITCEDMMYASIIVNHKKLYKIWYLNFKVVLNEVEHSQASHKGSDAVEGACSLH